MHDAAINTPIMMGMLGMLGMVVLHKSPAVMCVDDLCGAVYIVFMVDTGDVTGVWAWTVTRYFLAPILDAQICFSIEGTHPGCMDFAFSKDGAVLAVVDVLGGRARVLCATSGLLMTDISTVTWPNELVLVQPTHDRRNCRRTTNFQRTQCRH